MPAASNHDETLTRVRELSRAGAWTEALATLDHLAGVRTVEGVLLRAEALMRTGQERAALDWLLEHEALVARTDGASAHRRATNMMGAAALALGALDDAVAYFGRAVELAADGDDQLVLARATNNLGTIANMRGRHEDALAHYRLALPAFQRLGQRRGLAASYHNMAITYRDLSALDAAEEHERRAMDYAADGVAPRLGAMGQVGRAEIALRRGDARLAELSARRAAADLARLEDPQNEGDAWRLVGAACAAAGRAEDAAEAFDRALELARRHGHVLNEAECLRDRAGAHRRGNRHREAAEDARAAMTLFSRLGALREVELLSPLLAEHRGDPG